MVHLFSAISSYTLVELVRKTTKFLSDKAAEKSRFREISTDEKKKEKKTYRKKKSRKKKIKKKKKKKKKKGENAIQKKKKKPQTLVSNDKVK